MKHRTRDVGFLLYPGCLALDVTGPMEVFHLANMMWAREHSARQPLYRLLTFGTEAGPVPFSSGLEVLPGAQLDAIDLSSIDTLFVPGGWWPDGETQEVADICACLRDAVGVTRRIASVCTGSFFLAKSGLLDGRRATTHWAHCDALQREYPKIDVAANEMFVKDGQIYTAAGVTAGIDLALSMVEEDIDGRCAQRVACYMVLFLRRQGGQSQFSTFTSTPPGTTSAIRGALEWIAAHLDDDLRVTRLAEVAHMSERHFSRVFMQETGISPARFVERARVEAARSILEQTSFKLSLVASMCGFRSAEVLRRVVHRHFGISPRELRARFQYLPLAKG